MDAAAQEITSLVTIVKGASLPEKLTETVLIRLEQLSKLTSSPTFLPEYDRINRYIEWMTKIPWNLKTQDNLDLVNAKKVLDKNHYGLGEIKDRLFVARVGAVWKRLGVDGVAEAGALELSFVGLVGT